MIRAGQNTLWTLALVSAMFVTGCTTPAPQKPVPKPVPTQASADKLLKANDILFSALGQVGIPYRYGGSTPDSGFDCSGLIQYVYAESTEIRLPRTVAAMSGFNAPEVAEDNLQAGDLVIFATGIGSRPSHAGIYVGEGRFVHAPSTGGVVRMDFLSEDYWQRSYLTGQTSISRAGQVTLSQAGVLQPIGREQQQQVLQRTEAFIVRAEDIFDQRFERVPVLFDLKGRAAGMFKTIGKRRLIRYNPWIFAKYYEENLRDTVPHEVAHYIVHEVYPRRSTKPHGPAWKNLMAQFGVDAGVTFNLNLDGVPQRSQRTHRYHCGCQVHEVSTTRHNRVQRRKMRYHCCLCDGQLIYAPHATALPTQV